MHDGSIAGTEMDLRRRGGIPYGYRIINGEAVIDRPESSRLLFFYKEFLTGNTLSAAAEKAGLTCSHSTLPLFLKRKEYTGTEFYPAIITKEYQDRLVSEWMKRRSPSPARPVRRVMIHTSFTEKEVGPFDHPLSAAEYISCLYSGISDSPALHPSTGEAADPVNPEIDM